MVSHEDPTITLSHDMIDLPILDSAAARASMPGEVKAWRSREHLERTHAFQRLNAGEFAPEAAAPPTASNRRDFLKIMGASMALGGLAACRRPVEQILPYSRKPEEVIPGKPLFFATGFPFAGVLQPLLVESHEGRPTKVEPNPEHPSAGSGTSGYAQASVLNLYDPDRSRRILHNGNEASWDAFLDFSRTLGPQTRLAVVAPSDSSPTVQRLRGQLASRFPELRWVPFDPAEGDAAPVGVQHAFGRPLRVLNRFAEARVIVGFDAPFLSASNPSFLEDTRSYAEGRRVMSPTDEMSRLYVVESAYTTTGGMADHRLRIKAGDIAAFAAAVAARLGLPETEAAGSAFADHPWVSAIVDDVRAHPGRALFVAGPTQPAALHALCATLNHQLGHVGVTVDYLDTGEDPLTPQAEVLSDLVLAMQSGNVDVLLCLGTNPMYASPGNAAFTAAVATVETVIHLGSWRDETAAAAHWHIPASMYLEAWGDGRAFDGTLSVIQPLIAPLYDSKSAIEVLHAVATGANRTGYDLVRETISPRMAGDFELGWRRALHDGFIADTGFPPVTPPGPVPLGELAAQLAPSGADSIDLQIVVDDKVYDGTFANNAWMQETPDTITKVTWDNVAMMSRATRESLGLSWSLVKANHQASLIDVTVGDRTIQLPVWEVPGHADGAITVAMGYGRSIGTDRSFRSVPFWEVDADVYNMKREPLGNGVGANILALRDASAGRIVQGASIANSGKTYLIASTQDHPSMEGRAIVRMGTLETYRAHPTFAPDMVPPLAGQEPWDEYPALWEDQDPRADKSVTENLYVHRQWGMAIDLNTCIGCNACAVACQSENNIPVVGKEQVSRGREMSWMRIDRYFVGDDPDNPGMVTQPVMCQHCEDAPCESVCPVAATVHSPDGVNEMVYNRCIGTRYCANNCPYKVRRFNYFNWTVDMPLSVHMAQNPNVTVRFRGVMEKCQFCVQRVREAGIEARNAGKEMVDGDVQTACQQACPAQAITFGDVADPASRVSVVKQNDRNYALLPELNVKPRTTYLARLRNPNPALENANA